VDSQGNKLKPLELVIPVVKSPAQVAGEKAEAWKRQ
jgi:hypothetical protein